VTVDNSGEMRAALRSALRKKPAELRVDLSGLSYTDTSGLATLVEAFRTPNRQATRLVLAGIHGQLNELTESLKERPWNLVTIRQPVDRKVPK